VVKSGNLVEKYSYAKSLGNHQRSSGSKNRPSGYRKNVARRADNIRRTVQYFRRLVRANCGGSESPALITFTMLQVIPLATSWRLFSQFFDSFKSVSGRQVRYIAVPEFQERGAVHFHVLVWDLEDHWILHEGSTGTKRTRARFASWLAKKGYGISEIRNDRRIQGYWRHGYVDCVPTDGAPALAYYLSKYLTQTMRDPRIGGERAFSYSRNALRPVFTACSSFRDEELAQMGAAGEPDYRREFDTEWLGRGSYEQFELVGDNSHRDKYFDGIVWG